MDMFFHNWMTKKKKNRDRKQKGEKSVPFAFCHIDILCHQRQQMQYYLAEMNRNRKTPSQNINLSEMCEWLYAIATEV